VAGYAEDLTSGRETVAGPVRGAGVSDNGGRVRTEPARPGRTQAIIQTSEEGPFLAVSR